MPIPNVVVPSAKVTLPVGIPAPGATAVTVAVNVTSWPALEGLADDITVVLVDAWLTVWVAVDEVPEAKTVSPL